MASSPVRDEHDRPDVSGAEYRPGQRVPSGRDQPGGGNRPVTGFPRTPPVPREAIADSRDAHFLARCGRRRDLEQVAGQPGSRGAALVRLPFDPGPPCRREHRRHREDGEQRERRMNRHEQRNRHPQAQDPRAGRKQRHVHVIEHEDLVAQDRQPVQVLAALLVGDGGDRRQQSGDVRLECNRHLVAKPALHSDADGLKKPGGRGRDAERKHG